jgi:DNA polymerase-3 subunit epsilon
MTRLDGTIGLPDPDAVLFVDTETTGLTLWREPDDHPGQPHLVSLGVRLGLTGVRLLVQPPDGMAQEAWAAAEAVHGISMDLARSEGLSLDDAMQHFELRFVAQVGVGGAWCAHNLEFDRRVLLSAWLRSSYGRGRPFPPYGYGLRGLCTKLLSTELCRLPKVGKGARFGGYKWPSLDEAHAALLGQPARKARLLHDALDDVEACRRVYETIRERLRKTA